MVEIEGREHALIAPRRGQAGALAEAVRARFGLQVPEPGACAVVDGLWLARTAPHQLLAMRDGEGLFEALEGALGGVAGVFDLSDARAGVRLSGPEVRRRLRSLIPIDMRGWTPGRCAQTVMAHLPVLVCQVDDAPSFELYCARSYAGSFLRALH